VEVVLEDKEMHQVRNYRDMDVGDLYTEMRKAAKQQDFEALYQIMLEGVRTGHYQVIQYARYYAFEALKRKYFDYYRDRGTFSDG